MDVLSLRWSAKYGHFLRAEATVSALTYPIPPRPAVLGLLAALLGLDKDRLAVELMTAQIAVAGKPPLRFWHKAKLRKDPPTALPLTVKRTQKANEEGVPEKAALINQEWLWQPDFTVHVALPGQPQYFAELVERVQERRWHYTPCMGLSELLADVAFLRVGPAQALAAGDYFINGPCPAEAVSLRADKELGVHLLRLPHSVSEQRVFRHRAYYLERQGAPLPVTTTQAWQVGDWQVVFA